MSILAVPFLLPLMFQDDFGWSAAKAGAVVVFVFVGNLCIKPATTPLLRRFGFRAVLIDARSPAARWPRPPAGCCGRRRRIAVVAALLVVGGAFRSVGFTAYNTIAFADIDAADVTHANTLSSTLQQLAAGLGVAAGALALRLGGALRDAARAAGSAAPALHDRVRRSWRRCSSRALVEAWRLPRSAGAAIGGGAGRGGTSMRKVQ